MPPERRGGAQQIDVDAHRLPPAPGDLIPVFDVEKRMAPAIAPLLLQKLPCGRPVSMQDDRPRGEAELQSRAPEEPRAEVRRLAASRGARVQETDHVEHLAPEGQVRGHGEWKDRPPQVSLGREMPDSRRVALRGCPRRVRQDLARHAPDFLSVETTRELSQPTRAGDAVPVGERDYLPLALPDGPGAGMGWSPL